MLSGRLIETYLHSGVIKCNVPSSELKVGENSVDVTLSDTFLVPIRDHRVHRLGDVRFHQVVQEEYILPPGAFVLGCVRERFEVQGGIVQLYEGRSTVARSGLFTHLSAGFGDVGFSGAFTLELFNCSPWSLELVVGDRVGQISFVRVEGPLGSGYNGVYNAPSVRGPKGVGEL